MKKLLSYTIAGTIALTLAGTACAQSNSVTTTASTTILRPVTITENNALAFAKIVRPSTGSGTVTITPGSDTVVVTGTGTLAAGTGSQGKYTVNGEGNQVVAVTYPATFDMTDSGSDTLTVTLSSDASGGTVTLNGTLGSAGSHSLNIGGSFPITATTPTGAYSGQYTVSVAYQ